MAIIRTSPRQWRFTGPHARRAAPLFLLGTGVLLCTVGYLYTLVFSAWAQFTGINAWVLLLVLLALFGYVRVNERAFGPLLPLPGFARSLLGLAGVGAAVWYYANHAQWQAWLLGVFWAYGFIRALRQLKKSA